MSALIIKLSADDAVAADVANEDVPSNGPVNDEANTGPTTVKEPVLT